MRKVKVNLGDRSYNIVIGNKIFPKLAQLLSNLNIGKDAVIITNPLVKAKYGHLIKNTLIKSGFNIKFQTLPDSETSKSIKEAMRLVNRIAAYGKVFIIALGGGVVGDLAGFVASILRRGTPYIQIPTTLLAQIDSGIGGKTAIDLDVAKNQIGAFYQPRLVFSDISVLLTLKKRQIISGLSEAIKYGIIKDRNLFAYLERNYKKIISLKPRHLEHLVYHCSLIKAKIVSLDEKEKKGMRTILNFGHTLGHAIEAAAGYRLYNHGEAVGLGMLAATKISGYLGLLDKKSQSRIKDLIYGVGLPTKINRIPLSAISKAYLYDKKFIAGTNRFVVARRIGRVTIKSNVPKRLIKKVLQELFQS